MEQLNQLWRKSSYSGNNGGSADCVEAGQEAGRVLVRDTTDRAGFTMPVPSDVWRSFTGRLKDGEASRPTGLPAISVGRVITSEDVRRIEDDEW